jgi:hypothetical protein
MLLAGMSDELRMVVVAHQDLDLGAERRNSGFRLHGIVLSRGGEGRTG